MTFFRFLSAIAVAGSTVISAPVAWAEDLAVIVANEFYTSLPRIRGTRAIVNLERDFRDAGFQVQRVGNTQSGFAGAAGQELLQRLESADRLAIVVSGHVAMANGQAWLLHTDWARGNSFSVGAQALPLAPFLDAAAKRQGDAIIAVAEQGSDSLLGSGVRAGFDLPVIPQGVTVVHGAARPLSQFITNEVLGSYQSLAASAENAPDGVRVLGYLPRSQSFLPRTEPENPFIAEQALWDQTELLNTAEAYQAYLNRYPQGQYAGQARQRISALTLTPAQRAEQLEKSLNLSRNQRRAIQRNLTLLGFDTRGVDGVLGGNSRKAIRAWQNSIGVSATGYLNANQISRIETAATARAEQLRREAEERRRVEERRDRRYWNETGAGSSEAGMRAYLQRYPDGLFSEIANERLDDIERQRRREAQQEERLAWDYAVTQGNLDSYEAYLNTYPDGLFAEEARARVESLRNPETPQDLIDAAEQEERSIRLNGITRSLIEGALQNMGLKPGRVDGNFTPDTRRALRQFQRANSMTVTGYVTKQTLVRLLARAVDN